MGAPERRLLDERDYLAREAAATLRHEYVGGIAYAMAGAGERHNRIAGNLFVALRLAVRGTPCGAYMADMKLRVGHAAAYYYPDVMLSCEPSEPDSVFKEAPCLLAEVLSPSTAAIDTREKLLAYRGIASLHYYLIVDAERVAVTYYVRDRAEGEWLSASLDPGERLVVQCDGVRAELTLAGIYEDTGLPVP
jgi:Uma2 family endonuclease